MSAYNFFVSGPKFNIFSFNRGRVVVDQLHFRFPLSGFFPEIFAIKVESCEKSRQILDVFRPAKFGWGRGHPFRICNHVITRTSRYVAW